MALEDKKRYQKECDEYEKRSALEEAERLKQEEIRKQNEKRERELKWERNKDLPKPKKPMPAFFHYCKHQRTEVKESMEKNCNKKVSAIDVNKELGQRWDLLKKEYKNRKKLTKKQ